MNIKTEHLENHTARLTVEVEPARLEEAKRTAARRLAQRVNIPGFRKGKAPYRIVVNYVGEGAIVEDAVEVLGNEVYKEVLREADIEPFGMGQLEDVKLDEGPVFTFVIPKQPTVELGDYRAVRVDYTAEEISDEDVSKTMKSLQEEHALVEESSRPAALGNRVTLDMHAWVVDEDDDESGEEEAPESETPEASDADPAEAEATDEDDDEHDDEHDEMIFDEHDITFTLTEDGEQEPVPGFSKALEGAAAGETREFELPYPDDEEKYEALAGKRARFEVIVKKIEVVTLPALNDDFAARVTASEEKPLTLLELRMRVRENLTKMAEERAKNEYARDVLMKLVEQATIHYPEALIAEQIQQMLQQLDTDLRQRGLTLNDYMRIYRKSAEDLYSEYREPAIRSIERGLVLREILQAEGIDVSSENVDDEITRIVSRFGQQADQFRELFKDPAMRENVRNDLLNQQVLDRIVAIARGEAPQVGVSQTDVSSIEPVEPEEKGESA